jgi:hypothetical protein
MQIRCIYNDTTLQRAFPTRFETIFKQFSFTSAAVAANQQNAFLAVGFEEGINCLALTIVVGKVCRNSRLGL